MQEIIARRNILGAYFGALIHVKLRSRLQSREAIEDVRQETFTRFYVALRDGKIQHPERLGSFVNSICNNVLLEHYRTGGRHTSIEDGNEAADIPAPFTDLLSALVDKETRRKSAPGSESAFRTRPEAAA